MTLLVVVPSGCSSENDTPANAPSLDCHSDASAGLHLGEFGNTALPLSASDPRLSVWVPLQGGVVVGLDLLATGVPSGADKLILKVLDEQGTQQLGFLSYRSAHFLCSEGGFLTWRRGMIPLDLASVQSAADLDDQRVVIDAEARFPLPDGGTSELHLYQRVTLDEGAPNGY